MRFDWQTVEEDEPTFSDGGGRSTLPQWRRWSRLLLLALLALVAGLLLWREVERRTAAAEEAAAERVRASHVLARRAADAEDAELFRTLLSRRSEPWLEAQLVALEEGRHFARATRPLGLLPRGAEKIHDVQLDPDLRQAVLVVRQAYAFTGTTGVTETVTLEQSHVYRKGERHWLLSPPLADFWGETGRQEGQWLGVIFPGRDEVLARRLAGDLDRVLGEFCALPAVSCPPDLKVTLTLSTAPGSADGLMRLKDAVEAEDSLPLPTPTLIGLPVDEAGYDALLRGYATPLLARALARVAGYDCCRNSLFFSALLQQQLARIELLRWTLRPAGYDRVLEQGVDTETVRNLLQEEDPRLPLSQGGPRWRYALALVDFLEAELGTERLLRSGDNLFRLWLNEYGRDADSFVLAWVDFIYTRSRSGLLSSAPRPEGVLQFSCRGINRQDNWLLAYDFARGEWRELIRAEAPEPENTLRVNGYARVQALPGDYGYLVEEMVYDYPPQEEGRHAGRFRWHPGSAAGIPAEPVEIYRWELASVEGINQSYLASSDSTGRYLTISYYQFSTSPARGGSIAAWLIDLARCTAADCPREPLPGLPRWSPGGEQTLLTAFTGAVADADPAPPLLYHAGPRGENARPVGTGFSPFWLDEERYGFLRTEGEETVPELVLAVAGDDSATVIARPEDLLRALPPAARPPDLLLVSAGVLPSRPDRLLVRAESRGPLQAGDTYLFLLALAGNAVEEIRLLFTASGGAGTSASPTGRWLVIFDYTDTYTILHLLDLEEGTQRRLGEDVSALWSPSGQWLAQAHDQYLLLRSPATGVKHLVSQPLSQCRLYDWVEN